MMASRENYKGFPAAMQRILSVIHNSDLMSGIFTIGHADHLHCESFEELNGIKMHVTVAFFRNNKTRNNRD